MPQSILTRALLTLFEESKVSLGQSWRKKDAEDAALHSLEWAKVG